MLDLLSFLLHSKCLTNTAFQLFLTERRPDLAWRTLEYKTELGFTLSLSPKKVLSTIKNLRLSSILLNALLS